MTTEQPQSVYNALSELLHDNDDIDESTKQALLTVANATDDQLNRLTEENSDLKEELNAKDERIEELEQETELLESRIDSTVEGLDSLENQVEESTSNQERKYADISHRLTQLEEKIASQKGHSIGAQLSFVERHSLRTENLPGDIVFDPNTNDLSVNEQRALDIWENWDDWARKIPSQDKEVLSNKKHDLQTKLEIARGEELSWQQIKRVMDAMERITDGKVKHENRDRQGHCLVKDTTETFLLNKHDFIDFINEQYEAVNPD